MFRRTSPSFERSSLKRRRSSQSHYKNTSLSRRRARQRAAKAEVATQQASDIQPPQLPYFDFEIYNAQDYLPLWCPPMPSLQQNGHCPLFFDLSCLPEPVSNQKKVEFQPRKVSRFFPPRPSSPAAKVNLDVAASDVHHGSPSAANLWNILSTVTHNRFELLADRESSDLYDSEDTGGVPVMIQPLELQDECQQSDTFKTPCVHPNSLIGYANDAGAANPEHDSLEKYLHETALYLADLISPVDDNSPPFELAAMSWPLVPRSSTPIVLTTSASTPPKPAAEGANDTLTISDDDDLANSLAHYDSEQQLFAETVPLPGSPSASECDLAMLCSMDHISDCRCGDCDECLVLVENEIESPFTENDGWMVWETAVEKVAAPEDSTEDVLADSQNKGWLDWYEEYDWSV